MYRVVIRLAFASFVVVTAAACQDPTRKPPPGTLPPAVEPAGHDEGKVLSPPQTEAPGRG